MALVLLVIRISALPVQLREDLAMQIAIAPRELALIISAAKTPAPVLVLLVLMLLPALAMVPVAMCKAARTIREISAPLKILQPVVPREVATVTAIAAFLPTTPVAAPLVAVATTWSELKHVFKVVAPRQMPLPAALIPALVALV